MNDIRDSRVKVDKSTMLLLLTPQSPQGAMVKIALCERIVKKMRKNRNNRNLQRE